MKRCIGVTLLPAVLLVVQACGDAEPDRSQVQPRSADTAAAAEAEVHFAAELGIDLDSMSRTPAGVYYRDVRVGRGAVAAVGSGVTVEYRAWLPDGRLYEQRPNAEGWGASEFVLGESAPVPGLNEGMSGMRAGGVRRIVVPPEQGYGFVGRPAGVPPAATLVFEVRLIAVRGD